MGAFREYLDELDKKIEVFKSEHEHVSDIAILRLIYIDLGKKMNFDQGYTFGNRKQKKAIYDRISDEEEFDRAIESRTIICKSLSYMLGMILPKYGFKCIAGFERDRYGKKRDGAHVFNIVEAPDGKRFTLDLVEDLEFIQTKAKTKNFASDVNDDKKCVYDEEEIRRIDQEIGYIPEGMYMDDILWMMDKAIGKDTPDDVAFELILDNLNKYADIKNMGYVVRTIYYERIIDHFFNEERLDAKGKPSKYRIEKFDCYRVVNGERHYVSCIITNFKGEKIYLFNDEKNCYERIEPIDFVYMTRTGLEVPNEGRAKRLKRYSCKICSIDPDLG